MSPAKLDLTSEGRLLFDLYARLIVTGGMKPDAAFREAQGAVEYFMVQSDAVSDQPVGGASLGDVNAQLEAAAWGRFQKVKETAARLSQMQSCGSGDLTDYGAAQLTQSVAEAEQLWRVFGTFRLREALGQYKPEGPPVSGLKQFECPTCKGSPGNGRCSHCGGSGYKGTA